MGFPQAIALLLVLGTCASCDPDTLQIFVDGQRGRDELSCINDGNTERPCRTLEYIAVQMANITRPVRIFIQTSRSTFYIPQAVEFRNVSHVAILGMDTRISCSKGGGLIFDSVTNLEIKALSLVGCGVDGPSGLRAAIHIQNCMNVTVQNVTITRSKGVGVLFLDTYGEIFIAALHASENGNASADEYGNGLLINFTYCPKEEIRVPTNYTIINCSFVNNSGYVIKTDRHTEERFRVLRMGGGLAIQFLNDSCFNTITISTSNFTSNQARWGAGIFIRFKESPYGNNIIVSGARFTSNKATQGGGGACMGYYSNSNQTHLKNRIVFENTIFYRNQATYAGGVGIYAKHSSVIPDRDGGGTVTFKNCSWLENLANFSPAVDVTPYDLDTFGNGYLPIPLFTDCSFNSNVVKQYRNTYGTRNAAGAFLVTKFTVQFGGHLSFVNHSYSPLQVVSGTIDFQAGASVLFRNNTGIHGGAIAMYGFSSLNVKDNSSFRFINNTATDVGGAIYYQSLDQHDFVSSRTCFVQYNGCVDVGSRNLSMDFSGNRAFRAGDSIFAASLYPCYYQYFSDLDEYRIANVFQQIGKFTFDKIDNKTIGTEGNEFQYQYKENRLPVIPGKRFVLPVGIKDELDHNISTLYRLGTTDDSKLGTDRSYTANGNLRLFGNPCDSGSLSLHSVSFREIAIPIQVSFLHCPPGYFYYQDAGHSLGRCECAAYHGDHAYPGITHCNSSLFQAYIEQDYWAGYPMTEHVSPDGLYTAMCPLGFCNYELNSAALKFLLPNVSSKDVLDNWMCGAYRTGVLCGKCDGTFSVYYHSRQYTCATSQNCRLGVLYYILSELFPLAVLFTTVIVFDIRFTSGTANGFVFFSQVLDTLSIDARGAINFPEGVDKLSIGYSIIYGLLNFDFFSTESLSFCLWENATVLDIVAFKYITVVFALILVVSLVTLMRWCHCQRLRRIKRKVSTKDSVVHGLSAFLVMCYVQCTRVSFQILTAVTLTGEGGLTGPQVSFFGGIPYMGREHLHYAIPAYLCVATIVALPPIFLLTFPLYNHILAWFGLSENRKFNNITRFLLVERLKPLLDSFQGCFKGRLRFFAGLYFVYRIAILAVYTFSRSESEFYFVVEVLLILMLGLHATVQPYISRLHNITNSLVFANLTLINALTIYNYNRRYYTPGFNPDVVFWIQLVLIYFPLISVAVYIIGKIARMFPKTNPSDSELHDTLALDTPDCLIDQEHLPYHEFELSHRRQRSPPDSRPDFGFDD